MRKPVTICGRSISHRAARMLVTIAAQKKVLHITDPEHDWNLLTEEHIRTLTERTNSSDIRCQRGIGELIATELERFFSEFGILLRPAAESSPKPKWNPTPRWKQQPTRPGWYWWREHSGSEPIIYQITDERRFPPTGWWLGPLEAPRFDAYQQKIHSPRQMTASEGLHRAAA